MRKAVIGLALALAAASAVAQDGKGYVALGAGVSKFGIDLCDSLPSCDDSGFGWNFRGGYHFFPWLGVEASFLDFGSGTLPGVLVNPPANTVPIPTDSDVRASGFVASMVGRVPLGPVSLIGRVGWGAITGKFRGNAAVRDVTTGAVQYFSAQNRETSGELVYGAGVAFDFGKSWSVRVDWDRTSAEDGRNPKFDVEMFTAGVAYRF
ncbi:MAG TPA: porin family protein [Burkholderiaceae bacterium]|nr:porin family protein [Burkholderiaceae bacterium]